MKCKFLLIGFLALFQMKNLHAQELQPDSLQSTIVLIGDAGQLTEGRHPVISAIKKNIPLTKKTTVLYLGDNLYKVGLPDDALPTYNIAKAPLDSQISLVDNTPAKVYFIPGNHDWANGRPTGYESILRVQRYIDILGNQNIRMLPRDGCPGPEEIEITEDILLVMMDSQWWLHLTDKPGVESDCPHKTKEEVLTELAEILSKNTKKLILFAFHHPFKSYGPHGGYFTIKQHIFPLTDMFPSAYFPLPIIGSAYPLTRAVFGTIQDLKHPLYQDMITKVEAVVKGHPNVIFLSGHEHTLQLIQDSGYNYIVSGSGSKTNRVSEGKFTKYSSNQTGFATLSISKNKIVNASFYSVVGGKTKKEWSDTILDFSKIKEEQKPDSARQVDYKFKDSVVISASDKYKLRSNAQKWVMGNNYRKQWSTPIVLKEFNIRTVKGGLTPKSMGGGKQTKSLKLEDKNGKEWTLRSVDKDPEKAVPPPLRGTFAQYVVQDMISAGHPYAPLVVASLAKAVSIPAAVPEYYFVPDDYNLGIYRPVFANSVVIFEDREPTANKESQGTDKIINKMYEDNDHHVDQQKVLTARLLDMFIADWDRHAEQWKWGTNDTGRGKLYYPIPRDRDQAFFNSDGLLVKIATRSALPYMAGFKKDIGSIADLSWEARDLDRTFLHSLDEPTWRTITDSFINQMTDDVIKNAVKQLPPEIYPLDSAEMTQKLILRRSQLMEESINYYKFISKTVTVVGSNEQEYFHVENDKGRPRLSVFKKTEKTDSLGLMYRRTLDSKVTKELILYGLNNDDKFDIDPDVNTKIKLRIIGGKGSDTFNLQGNMRNYLYDLTTEKNAYLNLRRTNQELSSDPNILAYRNRGFDYDKLSFPKINLGFNSEDLLLIGAGFNHRKFGFRNEPYKSNIKFTSLFAPLAPGSKMAYQLRFKGEFNKLIAKSDLVINAEFVNPTLNNFFGFGNSTIYDKIKGRAFYRVRNKFIAADVLIRKRMFSDVLSFSAGPTVYHYWNKFEDNKDRILGKPAAIGMDSLSIYSLKTYAGGKLRMDINFIDNPNFPTRGITWFSEFLSMQGLNNNSGNLTRLSSDMTIYGTVSDDSKVTSILRVGGGKVFSKNPEFFQLLNLGANNFNRGFRKNRFAGISMLYAGAELRYRLYNSKSFLFPGDVGLIGFYDIGRVWYKDEASKKWHSSYGGGLYYAPVNLIIISASLGVSKESVLFNLSIGTKFNLNF